MMRHNLTKLGEGKYYDIVCNTLTHRIVPRFAADFGNSNGYAMRDKDGGIIFCNCYPSVFNITPVEVTNGVQNLP